MPSQLIFPKVSTATIAHDSPKQNIVIPSDYLEDPKSTFVSFPSTISAPVRPTSNQRPFTVPTSIIGQLIFHSQQSKLQKSRNQSRATLRDNHTPARGIMQKPTIHGRIQSRGQVRQRAITHHQNQLRLQQQQQQNRQQRQQQHQQQQLRQVRKGGNDRD